MTSWDDVELRHLRTLAAVAASGSFSRAADELGFSQSAVSQQVARLESLVGLLLVERPSAGHGVRLTAAGESLLARARSITGELARARSDLDGLAAGRTGVLRVGCFASAGSRLLPTALGLMRDSHPDVEIHLVEADDDADLLTLLGTGELDVVFVVHPVPDGPWSTIEVLEDPYVVVVPHDDPLAGQRLPLDPALLDGLPLVTYGEMRPVHAVENRLGRPWLADQVVLRSHDHGTIVALAAAGIGAAVVSWLSVGELGDAMTVLPLGGVPPRVVGLAWHEGSSAATPAFVAHTRAVAVAESARAADVLATSERSPRHRRR